MNDLMKDIQKGADNLNVTTDAFQALKIAARECPTYKHRNSRLSTVLDGRVYQKPDSDFWWWKCPKCGGESSCVSPSYAHKMTLEGKACHLCVKGFARKQFAMAPIDIVFDVFKGKCPKCSRVYAQKVPRDFHSFNLFCPCGERVRVK